MRKGLFLASVLLLAVPARAAEDGGPDDPGRFRVGVNLGIVSIPRPINVEGYARLHPYIGVSGGWSTFPKFASDAILSWAGAKSDTTVSSLNRFDAWEVALRVYPLRGSFFLGVGVGQQVIDAVVTEKQTGSPIGLGGSARVDSWVITPRIGWQWVWSSGFAMGLDLGAQFVLGHTESVVIPPGTPPDVEQDVRDVVHFGSTVPLPVIRFSLGYHFG
ncbi:MAG: hypothetical protein EHM78_10420 [Myxococcaceae bacterium]|nr:MAG: hypothetical protein EHM78_10420 [Myxococcaceae bacterium]